jgi:hypothetical protein
VVVGILAIGLLSLPAFLAGDQVPPLIAAWSTITGLAFAIGAVLLLFFVRLGGTKDLIDDLKN